MERLLLNINLLILGAGRGLRLRPLTDSLPKVLLPLNKFETILSRLIRQFKEFIPISNIWVNISTHPLVFLEYLSTLDTANVPRVILEPEILGSANTIFEFSKIRHESTLVLHGDLVLSDKYVYELIESVRGVSKYLLLCHYRCRSVARSQVAVDENSLITELINHGHSDEKTLSTLVNSGIYFLPKLDILGKMPELGTEIADSILQDLILRKELYCEIIQEKRVSVDSYDQLDQARKMTSR